MPRKQIKQRWLIDETTGCWIWLLSKTRDGYGQSWDSELRIVRCAHIINYEKEHGPVPNGLELNHTCKNRCCVNPAHLEAVTHKYNVLVGDGFSAKNSKQTHCKRGHEFTKENTHIRNDGARQCKICNYETQVKNRSLNKLATLLKGDYAAPA